MLMDPNTYYGFMIGAAVGAVLTQFFNWLEQRRRVQRAIARAADELVYEEPPKENPKL